jgi:copper chaperone
MLRLRVTEMHCNHCIVSVTKAVHDVAPDAKVEISLEKGEAAITGTTAAEEVIAAITDAGYDVERLAA